MVNFFKIGKLTDRIGRLTRLSTCRLAEVDHVLARWLPQRCPWCLSPHLAVVQGAGPRMPLCRRCQACLAWNVAPCERCAEPLAPALEARPAGTRLCGRCVTAPLALDTVVAPLIYRDEIRRLVQRFKAGAHRPSAHQLIALFLWALEARETTVPDVLMGVPRHRQRAREQGFDQSEWLASELGRRLGVPVTRGQRRRNDPPQHTLTASARRRQVKGMFDVAGPHASPCGAGRRRDDDGRHSLAPGQCVPRRRCRASRCLGNGQDAATLALLSCRGRFPPARWSLHEYLDPLP